MYEKGAVTHRLLQIAPDWEAAKALSLRWLNEWPHSCSDAEWWIDRHDELDNPKALRYFEVMTTPNN